MMDLRWHEGQIAAGRICKMPGVPRLQKSWGWSYRKARQLVISGEWKDPLRLGQVSDKKRTANGQVSDSRVEVEPTLSNESGQVSDSDRTESEQRSDTTRAPADSARVTDPQNTDPPLDQFRESADEITFNDLLGRISSVLIVRRSLMFDSYAKALKRTVKSMNKLEGHTGRENVAAVCDMWLHGPNDWYRGHPPAKFMSMLLRTDKAGGRVAEAWEWVDAGRPAIARQKTNKPDDDLGSAIEKVQEKIHHGEF